MLTALIFSRQYISLKDKNTGVVSNQIIITIDEKENTPSGDYLNIENTATYSLEKGKTITLWSSNINSSTYIIQSGNDVIQLSNASITGINSGTAIIKGTDKNNKTFSCVITVENNSDEANTSLIEKAKIIGTWNCTNSHGTHQVEFFTNADYIFTSNLSGNIIIMRGTWDISTSLGNTYIDYSGNYDVGGNLEGSLLYSLSNIDQTLTFNNSTVPMLGWTKTISFTKQ